MTQDNTINILAKLFQKKQYMEDFLDGNLHINHLGYYFNLESGNLKDTQADRLEGVTRQSQPKDVKISFNIPGTEEWHTIPAEDHAGPIYLQDEYLFNLKCLCFYSPTIYLDNSDSVKNQLLISKKMQDDFGDFIVFFHNPSEFLNRVQKAVKKNGYGYKSNRVNYFSSVDNFQACDSSKGFDKRDIFSFQKEYRILIETLEHEPTPLKLQIGNIRDICAFMTVDQFNNDLKIDLS
ncbi:hypothetical protein [Acinetobacter sp. HY1485]|uniref:hypothetical protein n=1 Tax=Acinetobacter sp. HY1485 TaxID=2970918 RepID=UPI0022B9816E|nr:hypothetical protein [Acinetobacter sp. HY1485]